MRLPPATATESYSVAMESLAQFDPSEVDLHLLALPALPEDLGHLAGPFDCRIHLELKGPHLLIRAKATGDLNLVCHRCLKEFPFHTELQIDEHMVVQPDEPSEEELEWDMASVAVAVDPNGEIELVDWLRQHLILDLPAKQLCEASCEILPVAVAQESLGDPRWGALRQLTSDQGDDHATT
ncbi:MAG: DUF177 domain-containing protein [Candidatus Sericytochromatia bacterium]|nr:DUF177 domain-containing protein [Candidatus Sericytochromatia bacterium]